MNKFFKNLRDYLCKPKTVPIQHKCKFFYSGFSHHFWNPDKPGGMMSYLDSLIEHDFMHEPNRKEDLENVKLWISQGYNACRTNWRRYKCSCGKTYSVEYHTDPFYFSKDEEKESKQAIENVAKLIC